MNPHIENFTLESLCQPFHNNPMPRRIKTPVRLDGKTIAHDNAKLIFLKEERTQYPNLEEVTWFDTSKVIHTMRWYWEEITTILKHRHESGHMLPPLPPNQQAPCPCSGRNPTCEQCYGSGTITTTDPENSLIKNDQFDNRQLNAINQLPELRLHNPIYQRLHFYGPGYIGCLMGIRHTNHIKNPLRIDLQ